MSEVRGPKGDTGQKKVGHAAASQSTARAPSSQTTALAD